MRGMFTAPCGVGRGGFALVLRGLPQPMEDVDAADGAAGALRSPDCLWSLESDGVVFWGGGWVLF